MATIGKMASETEQVEVPRGIVGQRRAVFSENYSKSLPIYATPGELPSTSVIYSRRESVDRAATVEDRDIIHRDERRHVNIEVTSMRAPADLVRRSPADDVSQLQRRVVLVRHPVNQDPKISVNEMRSHVQNQKIPSVNRVFPIVSVKVGEQNSPIPSALATQLPASKPPSISIFRQPGTGPIHKTFSFSTPSMLNEIRPIEGVDTISYDRNPINPPNDSLSKPLDHYGLSTRILDRPEAYSPMIQNHPPPIRIARKVVAPPISVNIRALERQAAIKLDSLIGRDDDVESEITEKEVELEKAKKTIMKLSKDLERLENDRKVIEGSVIEEEDLDFSFDITGEEKFDREKKVRIDAEEILRECNRMMIKLKEEEEADAVLLEKIQRGESSTEDVQREILRLQKQVTELNAMGIELPPLSAKQVSTRSSFRSSEDSSHIVSLKDQAVMFSTGSSARQEALISRLERELTDAQTCNHRLNAQLGSLANNNESLLKKEYLDLKKTLKERNDELDQLRKKVQKAEKDRQQWDAQKKQLESKLPVDVQLLLAQKKELTMQLDREQTEKHELFMQMNSYIAQLAECGDAEALKEEINSLQKRYKDLQDRSALLEQDLTRVKTEADIARRNFDSEKHQLQAEADDARKQLDMKTAALQSLMLAKQDNTRLELLTEENKRMQASVEELQTSLREAQVQMAQQLTNKLDQYHTNSHNAAQEELQRRLEETEISLRAALNRADSIESEKKQLQQSLDAKIRELATVTDQLRDAQQETQLAAVKHNVAIVQLQAEINDARRGGDDELRRLQEKERLLQTTLDQTSAKLDETKVALLSAESRAFQAESDLKTLDTKALNAERRVLQLQDQLSAAGNEGKQIELIQEQLKKAEERFEALLAKHQKTETAAQESQSIYHAQLEELQTRLGRAERDHREVMEKQTKLEESEKCANQKLSALQQLKQQIGFERDQHEEKVQRLEKELEQVKLEKQNQKSSVAEEITTLTKLTASLRNENSLFQKQISTLERDNHELKGEIEEKEYENEQLIKELEQARAMADSERQTLTLLKSTQLMEEESASKIKSELAHEKEARKKSEAELIAKFGMELEELRKEKIKIREEKTQLENSLIDLRSEYNKLEEEHVSHKSRTMEEEARLKAETSKVQTNFGLLQDSKRELEEQLKQIMLVKEETDQQFGKKLREAKEETEAVRREMESQKIRVRELEEERTRQLGSNDEEKKRLLGDLRFYREKADAQELEVANLRTRVTSVTQELDTHQAKAGLLQTRLDNLQAEYEEMKQVLHSSEESVEKMRESEQMAAKIRRQLEEIESEHRGKLKEELIKREELERKIDELTAYSKQQEMLQLASNDTQKEELEAAIEKISALESRLGQSTKAQNELLQNVKNLTALVESESKKIEEAAAEKRQWQAKAEELEHQLNHGQHNEEMNRLVTENARLSGELLTLRTQNVQSHQNNIKVLEEELHSLKQQNQRLLVELETSKGRTEELNRNLVQADRRKRDEVQAVQKELDRERQERERLQDRIDNMYSNGHSSGTNRTLSNMSAVTNMSMPDFTDIDDVDQLHKMMDKQKRIIKVLRRKLLKMEEQ